VKLIRTLKDVLGIGPGGTTDTRGGKDKDATELAVQRTDLALERTYMAAERTLMGWIRTSLSMISFGFTIGKLGEALDSPSVKMMFGNMTGVESVAYALVVLGTVSLVISAVQNRIEVLKLFHMGLRHKVSLAFVMAVLLSLLGVFAFTALVAKL
jgi:putative membrane protein